MVLFDSVTRVHVLAAIDEHDRIGEEDFLSHYGFKTSKDYVLLHEEKSYDSKAILGAAEGFATGTPAEWDQFHGGKNGAAKRLGDLGFDVEFSGGPVDASELPDSESRGAWAIAAREILLASAKNYRSVVVQKDLAAKVQASTGIHTTAQPRHWLIDVLTIVGKDCAERGEPLLPALCVNDSGSVGEKYSALVKDIRGTAPEDADNSAAAERLECHKFFGAELPSGGGAPLLTERLAASRSRVRKIAYAERVIPLCPNCQTALPAVGGCDNCT